MPLGGSIAGLFGRSPVKPLQKHYETAHAAAELLNDFFQAVIDDDWQQAEQIQQQIRELENQADELKKQFRLNLPKSLFLPMPRTDLLELVSLQDKVANRAKDVAGLMLGRKLSVPAPIAKDMTDYVSRVVSTSKQARQAIFELDELVETGFGGREVQLVENMIEQLDLLERETDDQQINIRAALFKLEQDLSPVDVMFLYKIIEWVGDLADRAQKVGGYLQILVAR